MAPILPFEIWTDILARLGKSELQSVRLISKAQNACATFKLFKCLQLNASTESLRQAYAIAASPILAVAVTHLRLVDDTIEEDCHDIEQFKERVFGPCRALEDAQHAGCDPSFDDPEQPFSPIMEHYQSYLARVADQKALRVYAGTMKMWSFLRRLPNLRHLERRLPDYGWQCTTVSGVTRRQMFGNTILLADHDFFSLAQIPTICNGFGLRSLALKPVWLESFEVMSSAQARQSLQATFCQLRKLSIKLNMDQKIPFTTNSRFIISTYS